MSRISTRPRRPRFSRVLSAAELALVSLSIVTLAEGQANAGFARCPVFPHNNVWNTRVDTLPVHAKSNAWIDSIGRDTGLHPDFGSGLYEGRPIGIPFMKVPAAQPDVPVSFYYHDESDPGPYPIPANAPIEGGSASDGDRHVLVVQKESCLLYELFDAHPQKGGAWFAGSGAVFDLRSNELRPPFWTSADAAGLPVFAGLVRYNEVVNRGRIEHALRFTAHDTRRKFVWPARHYASSITDSSVPPMGARFRLKASFDVTGYPAPVRVILTALKRYGMLLADNGGDWFISGEPHEGWDNDVLNESFRTVTGDDFEAVAAAQMMVDPDSGEARLP